MHARARAHTHMYIKQSIPKIKYFSFWFKEVIHFHQRVSTSTAKPNFVSKSQFGKEQKQL